MSLRYETVLSLLSLMLMPFVVGFVALGFWRRWWLLVPAVVAAAIFSKREYDGVIVADGIGAVFGLGILIFLMLGGGSGAVASALVISGRALRLRILAPAFVLPTVFIVGLSSFFVFSWTQQKLREIRNAPPSASCQNGLHPARLGSVELEIPIAPGLLLRGMRGQDDYYIPWHNPSARAFCSDAGDGPVALKEVAFMLDGMSRRSSFETQAPFCTRQHPEYPWANMACNPVSTEVVPDSAVNVEITIRTNNVDWIAKERDRMTSNPMSLSSNGVKIYRGNNEVFMERPDGFFVRCDTYRTSVRPWLYCSGQENLPEGLRLTYHFRTSEDAFLRQSPLVTASAHAMFQSIRRQD